MHEELKERLRQLESSYSGKAFRDIVNLVKRDKIRDEEVLRLMEAISRKRFKERVSFTLSVAAGNLIESIITVAAVVVALLVNSDWILYIGALVLLTTLHPLSHYITGTLVGIRFTHYYLDGPARFEPTLRIDYFSYLKTQPEKRALMHASGVIGTVVAPLIVAAIALVKGASAAASYLIILFLALIIFELLTSTKIGDLMRAKREYKYK